jgi:hypothetical protein
LTGHWLAVDGELNARPNMGHGKGGQRLGRERVAFIRALEVAEPPAVNAWRSFARWRSLNRRR